MTHANADARDRKRDTKSAWREKQRNAFMTDATKEKKSLLALKKRQRSNTLQLAGAEQRTNTTSGQATPIPVLQRNTCMREELSNANANGRTGLHECEKRLS